MAACCPPSWWDGMNWFIWTSPTHYSPPGWRRGVGMPQSTELCVCGISHSDCPNHMLLHLGWNCKGSLYPKQRWAVVSRGVPEVLFFFVLPQLAQSWPPSCNPTSAFLEWGSSFATPECFPEIPGSCFSCCACQDKGCSQDIAGGFLQPPSSMH